VLAGSEDPIAADALIGIQRTDSRERSSGRTPSQTGQSHDSARWSMRAIE
jgi:hypothetical protein